MTEVRQHNREAWNKYVYAGNRWTIPVTNEEVDRARSGDWRIRLTPALDVPSNWFAPIREHQSVAGCDVLCLAASGGQQAPLLSAAGANVTVLDQSDAQLEQDRFVAKRDQLDVKTQQGDMADLGCFADQSFDLVVNPCSTCFVEDIRPVWKEVVRVLRPGGRFMTGFCMPVMFLFDRFAWDDHSRLVARHRIPYSDLEGLMPHERQRLNDEGEPIEFGHSLDHQIGEQLRAGLRIIDFFEDRWDEKDILSDLIPLFAATLAEKPA